jgi:hypothetical protein
VRVRVRARLRVRVRARLRVRVRARLRVRVRARLRVRMSVRARVRVGLRARLTARARAGGRGLGLGLATRKPSLLTTVRLVEEARPQRTDASRRLLLDEAHGRGRAPALACRRLHLPEGRTPCGQRAARLE